MNTYHGGIDLHDEANELQGHLSLEVEGSTSRLHVHHYTNRGMATCHVTLAAGELHEMASAFTAAAEALEINMEEVSA